MTTNPLAVVPQKMTALANVEGQRAIQEVQAALIMAKRFPRDERAALDRILNSCSRPGLAEVAAYSYKRGGSEITGPSIRLAEAVAQHWGNMEFGFREISRHIDEKGVGVSEVEAYAWDMESNTRRPARFTVRHWRDTKSGGYALTDERDIYELTANMAQRRVRACILAVIPGDVIESASNQCDVTLNANADTSAQGIAKMVEAFVKIGVTKEQIVKKIGRNLDTITAAQIINLRKIHVSIKDGVSVPGDHFEMEPDTGTTGDNPLSKAKEEKPVETPPPSQPSGPTEAERGDAALATIRESIATGFDDPIAEVQFEGMLKAQGLLGATETLKGLKRDRLTRLENIAGSVRSIVETARKGGDDE